jgi:hypothetical protein
LLGICTESSLLRCDERPLAACVNAMSYRNCSRSNTYGLHEQGKSEQHTAEQKQCNSRGGSQDLAQCCTSSGTLHRSSGNKTMTKLFIVMVMLGV